MMCEEKVVHLCSMCGVSAPKQSKGRSWNPGRSAGASAPSSGAPAPGGWCARTRLIGFILFSWCGCTPCACDSFYGDVALSRSSLCFEDLDYLYTSCCFFGEKESICVFKHLFLGFARVRGCLRKHSCKFECLYSSNHLHINP